MDSPSSSRLLSAFISVAVLLALAAPAQATLPGKNGRIAFRVENGNLPGIAVVNPDGTGLVTLTNPGANSFHPRWSPTGRRLAFESDGDGNDYIYHLFVMDADDGGLTQVTHDGNLGDISWSPNGDAIWFTGGGWDAYQIQSVRADGTGLTTVTAGGMWPAWSPDGTRIAFLKGDEPLLYTMNPDGTGQRALTSLWAGGHRWSPDGTRIFYSGGPAELCDGLICYGHWIVNADGTQTRRLLPGAANAVTFDWSPDGTRIAYTRVGSNTDIYVLNVDTGEQRRLTDDFAHDAGAVWSPDGTRIAFTSNRNGGEAIYTMNPDGSDVRFVVAGHLELAWERIPPPARRDYRNASRYCKAEHEFWGAATFRQKYRTHGGCVSGRPLPGSAKWAVPDSNQ